MKLYVEHLGFTFLAHPVYRENRAVFVNVRRETGVRYFVQLVPTDKASRPMRMRLALLLSFSHACASIDSASGDVRCGSAICRA